MLNEKKIRKMTELARMEIREKNDAFKVGGYFKSDYIGLQLMKNLLVCTVSYALIIIILCFCHLDWLISSFDSINLVLLGSVLVIGYILFLAVFSVLTWIHATILFRKSKKKLDEFEAGLEALNEGYREQERHERRRERR